MEQSSDDQQQYLIAELEKAKIKHNPANIVKIAKQITGKIIFLETGKGGERGSGLQHILDNHKKDFLNRGISEEQIPDLIIKAATEGKEIGIRQGKSREIYQVEINKCNQYLSLEISDNGYIVSANPTPTRLIKKFIHE
jgi:hypothetical protein